MQNLLERQAPFKILTKSLSGQNFNLIRLQIAEKRSFEVKQKISNTTNTAQPCLTSVIGQELVYSR